MDVTFALLCQIGKQERCLLPYTWEKKVYQKERLPPDSPNSNSEVFIFLNLIILSGQTISLHWKCAEAEGSATAFRVF